MADYQSSHTGEQIDEGIEKILNGQIVERAEAAAQASAGSAQQAEKAVTDAQAEVTRAAGEADRAEAARIVNDNVIKESQSWAVGGTGTRPGEDTDNAKYWAGKAAEIGKPGDMTQSVYDPQKRETDIFKYIEEHGGGGYTAQPEPPADIKKLWIDTDDTTTDQVVTSVNGQTGDVDLTAADVGAVAEQAEYLGKFAEDTALGAALINRFKAMPVHTVKNFYSSNENVSMTFPWGTWVYTIIKNLDDYGIVLVNGHTVTKSRGYAVIQKSALQSWHYIADLDKNGHLPAEQNTQPIEGKISLLSGWSEGANGITLLKSADGIVTLDGTLKKSSPWSETTVNIGTLPVGFRPKGYYTTVASAPASGFRNVGTLTVDTAGALSFDRTSSSQVMAIAFTITYTGA